MDMSYLTRKENGTPFSLFLSKNSFFYNLLAVTHISKKISSQMYHTGKEVASLITMSSGSDRFPIVPHSSDEKALYH